MNLWFPNAYNTALAKRFLKCLCFALVITFEHETRLASLPLQSQRSRVFGLPFSFSEGAGESCCETTLLLQFVSVQIHQGKFEFLLLLLSEDFRRKRETGLNGSSITRWPIGEEDKDFHCENEADSVPPCALNLGGSGGEGSEKRVFFHVQFAIFSGRQKK